MRKVTEAIAMAFLNGQSKSVSNTTTDGTRVYLHGNLIATTENGRLQMTLAHWGTPTTRERLNGILNVFGYNSYFYQHKHEQYFNDRLITEHEWLDIPAEPMI